MRRGRGTAVLAVAGVVAYAVLMTGLAARESAKPTGLKDLRYERQQVRSFAVEGELVARQSARGESWPHFRQGSADMLAQQCDGLARHLRSERFTAAARPDGVRTAALAERATRALARLSAPGLTLRDVTATGRELSALAKAAER